MNTMNHSAARATNIFF